MAVVKIKVLKFEIGDFVVYRNNSRKFRSRAVRQCFTKLTWEQVKKLRKGSLVWIKDINYIGALGGEARGFNCEMIKKIKRNKPIQIIFLDKNDLESNSYYCNFISDFYYSDMKKLKTLISENPEALNLRFEE